MPVAVISGATHGIGKAIAELLLEKGCDLAICARNEAELTDRVSEWKAAYPDRKILARRADFSVKEEVLAFAAVVQQQFAQIDILVNNAGTFFPGKIAEEPDGQLEQLLRVNLMSAYHLTRALLPKFEGAAKPHIFNMCSVASLEAYENGGAYSISKYALLGFSDNLRLELMPRKIRVTAICPGAVWSRSWDGSGFKQERMMQVEDIASALWNAYSMSRQANVDRIVLRPVEGDL